jgi:hypothetical protein
MVVGTDRDESADPFAMLPQDILRSLPGIEGGNFLAVRPAFPRDSARAWRAACSSETPPARRR